MTPGMALADARARVPDLAVFDHDPQADRQFLEWLADGCERYTPSCALDPPQGLILDISGCAHIFGGTEAALARDLKMRLRRVGDTQTAPRVLTKGVLASLKENCFMRSSGSSAGFVLSEMGFRAADGAFYVVGRPADCRY
jgi:hypothetical protein